MTAAEDGAAALEAAAQMLDGRGARRPLDALLDAQVTGLRMPRLGGEGLIRTCAG